MGRIPAYSTLPRSVRLPVPFRVPSCAIIILFYWRYLALFGACLLRLVAYSRGGFVFAAESNGFTTPIIAGGPIAKAAALLPRVAA